MKTSEIRQAFLDFFKSKGHAVVSSAPLVPSDDQTLLFTNAGMVQFKNCFLGSDKRSYARAVSCQKCLRISGKHNDFENVGVTARHNTFFEMLGNFSFGDYFKREAIQFAWELITQVLKLDRQRLWVSIYEKDDEAQALWEKETNLLPGRIVRLGEKDNFWAMGETGPCGPCSEIYYYLGQDLSKQNEADFRKDDGSYLEFWNLVFMQFDRDSNGKLSPLPRPCVDTGMGLDRTAAILQGVKSSYDADLLRSIISVVENLSGCKYDGTSYTIRDLKKDKPYAQDVAMRAIADHARAMTFLITEGIYPESEGRGYVLRRIIRRAVRHGRVLNFDQPFLGKCCERVIELMGTCYPEIVERRDSILKVVDNEERKFFETLDAGLTLLTREVEKVKKGRLFPGESAFLLHDTYGFPLDLTQDALKAYKLEVDLPAYEKAMQQQRDRSREDRKAQGISFKSSKAEGPPTKFVGYQNLQAEAALTQFEFQDSSKKSAKKGDLVSLYFDATPFYAESGGQVGDSGKVQLQDVSIKVLDTQKVQDHYYMHIGKILEGELTPKHKGQKANLIVDAERRRKIRDNHSATHLLHSALRKVLGQHVKQAGSRVDDKSLRFDFSHFNALSATELSEIQSFVNSEIRNNYQTGIRQMNQTEAKKAGAMALFGEKYGDIVRVVEIGPSSLELCGGTHVQRSGDIGLMLVASEGGVAAGVRRIECWAGAGAYDALQHERLEHRQIAELIKSDPSQLPEKIEKILARQKILERELEALKAKLASSASGDLADSVRTTPRGIRIIAEKVEETDSDTLRNMVDSLRIKLGSGVVALAARQGEKAVLVAGVTADLTSVVKASDLVREAAKLSGGKGGGRADFAQAGGIEPGLVSASLAKVVELVS